jgi:hypothetical protein
MNGDDDNDADRSFVSLVIWSIFGMKSGFSCQSEDEAADQQKASG